MPGRLLVGAGRADKDVLPRAALKQLQVAFDVWRFKSDPVHDGVEGPAFESAACSGLVVDVASQGMNSRVKVEWALPARQEREVDAAFRRKVRACSTDDAGAADEENVHAFLPVSSTRR